MHKIAWDAQHAMLWSLCVTTYTTWLPLKLGGNNFASHCECLMAQGPLVVYGS